MSIVPSIRSRQPARTAIPLEELRRLRSLALGAAIENSTAQTYGSALNSYLSFIRTYAFPTDPTPDTLSLYIVFMCQHIRPQSVESYLTGLCHELLPHFPDMKLWRMSQLVTKTLKGCKKLKGTSPNRKHALTLSNLCQIPPTLSSSDLDDALFMSLIMTGFFGLLRLGELTYPDNYQLHDPRKVSRRSTVTIRPDAFSFILPFHKADRFFEGNIIIIKQREEAPDPYAYFLAYLRLRDERFPFHSALWITSTGEIPTRGFFIKYLRRFFDKHISGHSMRAGGATFLAEKGVAPHLIQAAGRWSSDAWQLYVRKNPMLMESLLHPNVTSS